MDLFLVEWIFMELVVKHTWTSSGQICVEKHGHDMLLVHTNTSTIKRTLEFQCYGCVVQTCFCILNTRRVILKWIVTSERLQVTKHCDFSQFLAVAMLTGLSNAVFSDNKTVRLFLLVCGNYNINGIWLWLINHIVTLESGKNGYNKG